jgi:hypothetical protein
VWYGDHINEIAVLDGVGDCVCVVAAAAEDVSVERQGSSESCYSFGFGYNCTVCTFVCVGSPHFWWTYEASNLELDAVATDQRGGMGSCAVGEAHFDRVVCLLFRTIGIPTEGRDACR